MKYEIFKMMTFFVWVECEGVGPNRPFAQSTLW